MKITPEDVYESVERLQDRVRNIESWVARLIGFQIVMAITIIIIVHFAIK